MVNEHKQTVCDRTSIIVNDGKTLFPGYVEVKEDGSVFQIYSDDPRNKMTEKERHTAKIKPWDLFNRIEYRRDELYPNNKYPELAGKHFTALGTMLEYLQSQEAAAAAAELSKPAVDSE